MTPNNFLSAGIEEMLTPFTVTEGVKVRSETIGAYDNKRGVVATTIVLDSLMQADTCITPTSTFTFI